MRVAFYGDDFTGAADALLQYHRWGLRGRLFFSVPSPGQIAKSGDDVVGVAGIARSLPTAKMEAEILPFFRSPLREAPILQYKVCSTFDSSESIGSIGHVIGIARRQGLESPSPVLPAQPHFGRYTLFANHYARYGDEIMRLDRHPTMANHPSTPMREADLRRVLASQGAPGALSFDLTALRAPDASARLGSLIARHPPAIVFDALEDDDLVRIGTLLMEASGERLFAIGSGGFSYAVGSSLGTRARREAPLDVVERVFILSGSMAPQNAEQIEWALANGWNEMRIDPYAIDLGDSALDTLAEKALALHRTSPRGVIVRSASDYRKADARVDPALLGGLLGGILLRAFRYGDIARAVVCGGDTSSYAARVLRAHALSIAQGFPDVPASICRLHSDDAAIDGRLLMLKGGQVGGRQIFETVRTGSDRVASKTFAYD